jgi:predicted MFS family arabinose efflux permease
VFAPSRVTFGLRPHASLGVLAAVMVSTTTFVSTPFLLPEIAAEYGVSLGTAGIMSTVQVGAFAVVNLVAGRWRRAEPSVRLLRIALVVFLLANVVSAAVPWFGVLLAVRAVAGASAGILVWIAWSDAAAEPRRLSDVAAAGPIASIVGALLFGAVAGVGADAVFLTMAGLAIIPIVLPASVAVVERGERSGLSPSRSNRVLLLGLTAMPLFGSSLFVYAAAAAQEASGLSASAAAGAYSLNALGGLVGSRLSRRASVAAPWVFVIAASLLAVGIVENAVVFYVAMTVWGFAFWIAVPRILRLIAQRSYSPDERVGDAQAGMAAGRAIGPAMGAGFATEGAFGALAVAASSGMAVAGTGVAVVEVYRRRGGDADVQPRIPLQRWLLPGQSGRAAPM